MPTPTLAQLLALLVVAIGTVTDLKTRKIYNVLTFPAAAVAIALHYFQSGVSDALMAVGGWFAGALLMAMPILLLPQADSKNRKGFGDIKLMATTGAFLGPKPALYVFFYFCIFYGIFGIGRVAIAVPWHKIFMQIIGQGAAHQITAEDLARIQQMRKSYMPLGPAIFAGVICAVLLDQYLPKFFG